MPKNERYIAIAPNIIFKFNVYLFGKKLSKYMKKGILIITVLSLLISKANAQQEQNQLDTVYTPYELMSSYYENNFAPFKKKNIYIGLSFSIEDKQLENADYLIQRVINGDRLDYDIVLKGGYYIGDYAMVGVNLNYYQNKFEGTIFREPDTLQSKSITRGYSFTPNIRSSVPLTENERLSFFTQLGVTFGMSTGLIRDTKNLDEVQKQFNTDYRLRVGLSPGITFFAMENFAFEVQLDLLGYDLRVTEKKVNDESPSREVRQNVDFNIDILSLQLGLAYYF